MAGILEEITDRISQLALAVEAVVESVRSPEAADLNGVPLAESERIWAAGAMDLADAIEFSGISRGTLYALMNSGELPFSVTTRERLVPRLWFIRYLAAHQVRAGRTKSVG